MSDVGGACPFIPELPLSINLWKGKDQRTLNFSREITKRKGKTSLHLSPLITKTASKVFLETTFLAYQHSLNYKSVYLISRYKDTSKHFSERGESKPLYTSPLWIKCFFPGAIWWLLRPQSGPVAHIKYIYTTGQVEKLYQIYLYPRATHARTFCWGRKVWKKNRSKLWILKNFDCYHEQAW